MQLVKEDLAEDTGIAHIFMLQTQTAQEKLEDSLFELERAIQAEAEKQAETQRDAKEAGESHTDKPTQDTAPKPLPVTAPKPVIEVSATKVFGKLASGIYLEKQEDVDDFVSALKDELQTAIAAGKRVRLK